MTNYKRRNPVFQIRELRKEKGIGLIELSRVLSYSRATICNWESGFSMPTSTALPRIAKALGCSVNDLYRPEVL